jgi:GT2 family glycosyltransferase
MQNESVMHQTVSVIVPTFNRAHYLTECLDSLLAQTVPLLEILVIDDGSEDATAEVVARYGGRIKYIYKENGGKPSAVNLGLTHARGDLIWLFDDDDVALPDATADRLAALAAAPDAGFVYSGHYLGADGADGRIVIGRPNLPPEYPVEVFFLEIMQGCFFHLGTALVRREYYERLNGLDPTLSRGQDYDFQIRLARVAQPAFCAKPTFIFRQHAGVRGTKKLRHTAVERRVMFKKFSQAVGRKLRAAVDLGEYLVPIQMGALSIPAQRVALANRIRVMGNHGCVDEVFEDLRLLLELANDQHPLSSGELKQLTLTMQAGFAYDASVDEWPQVIRHVHRLRPLPSGSAAIRALARGLLVLAKSYPGTFQQRVDKMSRAARLMLESLRFGGQI